MRVRMTTTAAGPAGVWPVGVVVVIDEAVAHALVAGGYAEAVDAPRRIPEPPAQETAALAVPETAERGRVSPQRAQSTQRPEQRRAAKVQKGKG